MKLHDAEKLAIHLMLVHKVEGWIFKFDNAVSRFGLCSYRYRTISLSKKLTEFNSVEEVTNTILHEIAHALVGHGHGHNKVWQRKAVSIGCSGDRCYSHEDVITQKSKYLLVCENCGYSAPRHKKPSSPIACGKCCRQFNKGKYSEKFVLLVKINH